MTLLDAIHIRRSVRHYTGESLTSERQRQLEKIVAMCNKRSGLHIRLITGDRLPFDSFPDNEGWISGVSDYLLLDGPEDMPDLDEKCGYFGELLILNAVVMGLGTCWIGGSYDPEKCPPTADGDRRVCLIAVGLSCDTPQKRTLPSPKKLSAGLRGAPHWFHSGVDAVRYAPSAMGRQAWRFTRRRGNAVDVSITENTCRFDLVDLGIAKLHFEIGAHGGTWSYGDGGSFRKAGEEKSCGAVVWKGTPEDHQYLLIQMRATHWSFPKGHVEGRETETETAYREILEETGLTTDIDTSFREVVTYYPKPGIIKDVIFFLATPTGGKEKPQLEELIGLDWFTFDEARPLVTFATDEDVLLAAEKRICGLS